MSTFTTYGMTDIISLLCLPLPPHGRASYYIPCPRCDNERQKHLNVNVKKNVFRCPRCGFSGGIFDLYAEYTGVCREDVKDALDAKLASTVPVSKTEKANPHLPPPVDIQESVPADILVRDMAYRTLLEHLSLAPDHMDNLLGRGLSDKAISERQYRTTPVVGSLTLAKCLIKNGCTLEGVPGFYINDAGEWTFMQTHRGILIPVRDSKGRVQGLQIRRDNVSKRKYRWVSSSEMKSGCKAEGWTHIAGPIRERILLTEGPMKADIIHHLTGQTVLAVPGVNSLSHLERTLLELKELGLMKIMTCFDMDFLKNFHVQNGYHELALLLDRTGFEFGTYLWHPDYNGLDDYIWKFCLAHDKEQQ